MRDEALDKALEAILDDAAVMADEKIGEALCDPEENIQFSAESEQRMKKLFKRERRKLRMKRLRKSSKWTACVLLAVIVVSGVTIFSVSAWRVRFLNFILDIGQPNTDYSFGDEQDHSYSDDEITLGYIPDGFKMAANKSNSKSIFLRFESENQYFHFSIISLEGRSSLDTENGTPKESR